METVAINKPVVRTSEVIGVNVTNLAQENLGKIYEIVIDKLSGQVKYAVLESGAILGLGGKFFTIPWNSLKYDEENNAFIVGISQSQLKNAPGFDKNNWPIFSDKKWSSAIENFYTNLT